MPATSSAPPSEACLAAAADQRCGGKSSYDGAGALDGDEDTDEGGGSVEAVAGDGVQDRLAETEHGGGHGAGDHDLAELDGATDVGDAGDELSSPLQGHGLGGELADAQGEQRGDRDGEGRRIQDRH